MAAQAVSMTGLVRDTHRRLRARFEPRIRWHPSARSGRQIRGDAVGIEVAWVDETHVKIQVIEDPNGYLTALFTSDLSTLAPTCLRFVDPWGDTIFNQNQIPVLLAELRAVASASTQPELHAHIEQLVDLVEQSVEQMHTYIKFIGD
jgi:hypothetical protein